ncbi:protein CGI121 [Thozetella sp. PMI_491]|nr:protein CGI121 [Thozetella sp. PMI_491]
MALEALHLEHVPDTHKAYAAFFKDVSNPEFLHQQLLARNADFEYAFIDASSVLSRFQILSATYKAFSVLLDGTLKTPNVHSEAVCALSPSNNIAEAYRRWGITPASKDIIIIKILFPTESQIQPPSADDVWTHLSENIKGTPVELTDAEIAKSTDLPKVRKYYKLNGLVALEGIKDEAERAREMGLIAVAGMALRGL